MPRRCISRSPVDDVDVVADAHLDRFGAASVGADPLAAAVCVGDGGGAFLVGEVGVLSVLGAGDFLAGHGQLDLVHAEVDQFADGFAHAFGSVGELGDGLDQGASGAGDLGAVGEVAGAGGGGTASALTAITTRRLRRSPTWSAPDYDRDPDGGPILASMRLQRIRVG
jgi:hypothetical protein